MSYVNRSRAAMAPNFYSEQQVPIEANPFTIVAAEWSDFSDGGAGEAWHDQHSDHLARNSSFDSADGWRQPSERLSRSTTAVSIISGISSRESLAHPSNFHNWWQNLPGASADLGRNQPAEVYKQAEDGYEEALKKGTIQANSGPVIHPQEVNLFFGLGGDKPLRSRLIALAASLVAQSIEQAFEAAAPSLPKEDATWAEYLDWQQNKATVDATILQLGGCGGEQLFAQKDLDHIFRRTSSASRLQPTRGVTPPTLTLTETVVGVFEDTVEKTHKSRLREFNRVEGSQASMQTIFSSRYFLQPIEQNRYDEVRKSLHARCDSLYRDFPSGALKLMGESFVRLRLRSALDATRFNYQECLAIWQVRRTPGDDEAEKDRLDRFMAPLPNWLVQHHLNQGVDHHARARSQPALLPRVKSALVSEHELAVARAKDEADDFWRTCIAQAHKFCFLLWAGESDRAIDVMLACAPWLETSAPVKQLLSRR